MLAGFLILCAAATSVRAIDVPDPAWANYAAQPATANYYDSAAGLTGNALKLQLRTIVDTNDVVVAYDSLEKTLPITDRVFGTAASANRMSTVYDFTAGGVRTNISGVWDSGTTWNREHVWPNSRIDGNDHDMFNIRPALTATNGGRGNNYYGGPTRTGAAGLIGNTTSQFFAGDTDKGDVARECLFMATRYSALTLNTVTDTANGTPAANNDMGDLNAMLHWHYLDLPDNFERRRNQYIYKNPEKADVGSGSSITYYSQRNRNPYVDHPEYVWAVWGTQGNDSQITVNTGAVGGASSKNVDFGRVIVGGAAPALTTSVAISKTGSTPTTFSVTTAGQATADGTDGTVRTNIYNAFDYNAGSKNLSVGLTGVSTATAGRQSGSVTIDNTDLTTLASVSNSGVNDGDDAVNLSLTVLDHSNASFASSEDADTLFLNFQAVNIGTTATLHFSLANLLTASGYTAGLDLDTITAAGDTVPFGSDLATFAALQAGTSRDFTATFTPTKRGTFYAEYTLGVSDENLSGATAGSSLTIVLSGVTNAHSVPEPVVVALLPIAAALLRRRRIRCTTR